MNDFKRKSKNTSEVLISILNQLRCPYRISAVLTGQGSPYTARSILYHSTEPKSGYLCLSPFKRYVCIRLIGNEKVLYHEFMRKNSKGFCCGVIPAIRRRKQKCKKILVPIQERKCHKSWEQLLIGNNLFLIKG